MFGVMISQIAWLFFGILLIGSLIPISENYAKIETASIIGGYIEEGEYVGITGRGETVHFVIDEDNKSARKDAGCDVIINENGRDVRYSLYYSNGMLHLSCNSYGKAGQPGDDESIVKRDKGVYSVYAYEDSSQPFLTFVRENDKSAYERMIS